MTIKEVIIKNKITSSNQRILDLVRLGAPEIIIERENELLEELNKNEIKISDKENLLDIECSGFELKTGRGGNKYILFNKDILYFPNSRYGRFITRASIKEVI